MEKVNVSKKKYVDAWIDKGLIPGAERDMETNTYRFPDSARRPYQKGLKGGMNAERLRTHIVKAALERKYISAEICFTSPREYKVMVDALVEAGLIQRRHEDGIEYLDSTMKSEAYINRDVKELHRIVLEAVAALTKATAEGAAAAALRDL
ncbi:MAG: hypothetical protein IKH56_00780 [Oscillospiraceae bacterium]|nr:hypothetical protein [Oscillospiraceae bacterium]